MAEEVKRKGRKKSAPSKIRIRLVKSPIGYNHSQALVVRGLGLRRIGHTVDVVDHPSSRGMIHKVRHLVVVEEAVTSVAKKTRSKK